MESGITDSENTSAIGTNEIRESGMMGKGDFQKEATDKDHETSGDEDDKEDGGDERAKRDKRSCKSKEEDSTTTSDIQNNKVSKPAQSGERPDGQPMNSEKSNSEEKKLDGNTGEETKTQQHIVEVNSQQENETHLSTGEVNKSEKEEKKRETQLISIEKRSKDDGDLNGPKSRGVNFNLNNPESDSDDNLKNGKPRTKKLTANVKLFNMPTFPESPGKFPQKGEQQLKALVQSRDSKHFKQWLRNHHWPVAHSIRKGLWKITCEYVFKSQSSIYHEMVEDLFKDDVPEVIPLPLFVDTEHMPQYCLTPAGIDSVHIILIVLDQLNPDVTFCPSLFPVAALFLHFMEAEECFNCLYAMVRTTESRYFPQTNVAVDATYLVMKDLAKHHAKSAYSSIFKDTDGNVEPVFRNWVWWIFEYLPFPILVPVMDCYLYEGMKVLYRVALAILILFHKHTVKLHEPHSPLLGANVSARIKHFCEDMPYSIDKILKTAFGIRGLGRKELRKLQVRHEMYEKSQTVRMTRASSFARPSLRNSFSVPSQPSRSMSIPAPLSSKRSKTKGDTIGHELDTDSSDSDSESLLSSELSPHHDHYERSPVQEGHKVKVAHVDHSAQTISYDHQTASTSTGVNTDQLGTSGLPKKHVHYNLLKSSKEKLAAKVKDTHPRGHSEVKRQTCTCEHTNDNEAEQQFNGSQTSLTSDRHTTCTGCGRSRSSSHSKVKGRLQHDHIYEDDHDSETALAPHPQSHQGGSKSQSHHNTKVKLKGKLIQNKHTGEEPEESDDQVAVEPSQGQGPCTECHPKARCDCRLTNTVKRNKHEEEVAVAGVDPQVTSRLCDTHDPYQKSRSSSHHKTKVKGQRNTHEQRTLEHNDGSETALVPHPHSQYGGSRSQSHHSTKVKLKGKLIQNKHTGEETEPAESDDQVTFDPPQGQGQGPCTECHPKPRCDCKITNTVKRNKHEEQDEQNSEDLDLPSTSKHPERSNSFKRSRPKSIRDHRAKIRAIATFSLKGRSKRKIVKEEEETLPQSSSSDIIDVPRSRSLTHLHVEAVDCYTLRHKDLMLIWSWLPARYTICQPHLLFTTELHGISLATLYRRIGHHEPTLLVIKTGNNEVFGAFCSTDWGERTQKGQNRHLSYFGTGETFVFTLSPKRRVYYWVGLSKEDYPPTASMFLAADHKALQVGGGNGTAIHLDAGLVHCRTEKCDTFDNDPLCSSADFSCKVLEVFGFQ